MSAHLDRNTIANKDILKILTFWKENINVKLYSWQMTLKLDKAKRQVNFMGK